MGQNRVSFRSFRRLFIASYSALALTAACGKNPELAVNGDGFNGSAGLGEACSAANDCVEGLVCGARDVCVGACGDVTSSKACGDEACLPNGYCSEGLGSRCTTEADCGDALACSELGFCAVPCKPGASNACKNDAACRPSGTCPNDQEVVIDPPSGIGGESGGEGGAPGCIDTDVDFEPQVPTVLLLIDRSGSMNADSFGAAVKMAVEDGTYTLGDCPTIPSPTQQNPDRMIDPNDWRWNVVRDVLMSETKGIIKPLEDRVRFGLSLYSGHNGQIKPAANDSDPIELDPTKMCPELVEVPIALGNHQAMLDEFKCSDIADDTPTGESLLAAAATLAKFKEPGPKVIVLATDGEPDNCECPDFGGHVPAKCKAPGIGDAIKAEVVATTQGIHEDGVTVHVINVSTPGNASLQQHLADVAEAGGGNVYPGFSPGALSMAFEDIINGVRSCKIDLDGEIAKGKASSGTVTLDGSRLELDDENGWQVNSPSQIELLGEACEVIKSGDHDLKIKFPCGSFKPPVH